MFQIHGLAYIDPTSGSILLQALLAGILGISWRITSLFRRRRKENAPAPVDEAHAVVTDAAQETADWTH